MMGEKEIKIYQSINEKKGIISVNFYNPVTGRKTTKSLGKEVGIDNEKAQIIIDELKDLINNEKYYCDYTGYLEAKRNFKNEMVLKMVFSGAEFLKLKNEEERIKYIDNRISIIDGNGIYRGKSIQLLGDSGAGKTKTIQQLLGSVRYNTPASTTSNTTVSDFEAVIKGNTDRLKMVVSFLDKDELSEYIKDNVIKCIKIILSSDENEELSSKISTNIMISDDMKLRLNFLLRNIDKDDENMLKVHTILNDNAIELWNTFTKEKMIDLSYREASKEIKNSFSEYIEEERDKISEECIKILMQIIIEEMNKVIKKMISSINETEGKGIIFNKEIVSDRDKYENIDNIHFNEKEWPKYFYFEILGDGENKTPSEKHREIFWKIYRNISCADEDMPNLYPLVASSRVEGNFKPLWVTGNEIENAVIIDSEGFGHDVDKLIFTSKTIRYMQKVDRILWIADSTRAMTNNDKLILEELLRNGCINKVKMCFNRLEKMDKKSEASDEAKQQRIDLLINNLFKYFEEKAYENSIDVYAYKENVMQRDKRYYFDYLDEVIEDEDGILTEETRLIIEKLNLKDDSIKGLKTQLKYTIKSFGELIEWINSTELEKSKSGIIDYSPMYSSSVLSRYCDTEILKYKIDIRNKIWNAHWNTVRAFTSRMVYNLSSYRGWGGIYPENELKMITKNIALDYLMKPLNYNNCKESDKKAFMDIIQSAQNSLAIRIDEFIEKRVNDDMKEKWKEALGDSGPGSGLRRKSAVIEIFDEIFLFDKEKREKNMIYIELHEAIKENEVLVELDSKIGI